MDGLLELRAKARLRPVFFCRSCWRADRAGGIHVGEKARFLCPFLLEQQKKGDRKEKIVYIAETFLS